MHVRARRSRLLRSRRSRPDLATTGHGGHMRPILPTFAVPFTRPLSGVPVRVVASPPQTSTLLTRGRAARTKRVTRGRNARWQNLGSSW
jgi:hypothetical protein